MDTVELRGSALRVSVIGLGCMGFSGNYGPVDDERSIAVIHRALDLGVNFLDSSVSYGRGHNLELIGRALADRRDKAVVHVKFGARRDAQNRVISSAANPNLVAEDCEFALTRLKTDHIDIFTPSRVTPGVPIEDTIAAVVRLVEAGKVRHIGLSEAGTDSIRKAQSVHPLVTLQMEYSLLSRDIEEGQIALCRELGMAIMAYGAVARGLLSERSFDEPLGEHDRRRDNPRFDPANLPHNLELCESLVKFARTKGITAAQAALAWVRAHGDHIIPIPGARTLAQVEENTASAEIRLSPDEVAWLDERFAPGAAAGTRYGAGQMAMINR